MTGLEFLGAAMLLVMLAAIFIGLPISFTLLFLALIFGYFGLGARVFDLSYLQTFGLMKQDEFVAVPMFILMGLFVHRADTSALWARIDWSVLLFFAGLFVAVEGLSASGATTWFFERCPLLGGGEGAAERITWPIPGANEATAPSTGRGVFGC